MFVCKDVFDVLYILRNSGGEISHDVARSLTEFDKASENQYLAALLFAVNRINIQPQSQ